MAFIEFKDQESVNNALELDGSTHFERFLKVKVSNPRGPKGGKGGGFSGKRELSEKPPGCTTVFVGNLSYDATEEAIMEAFTDCGECTARIAYDKETGKSRGFGHVEFTSEDGVAKAIEKTGTEIAGRAIRVDYAGGRQGGGGGGGGGGRGRGDRGGRGRGDRGGRGRGDRGGGRGRGRGNDRGGRGRGRGRGGSGGPRGGVPKAEGTSKKIKLDD